MDIASILGLSLGFLLLLFGTIQAGLTPLDILNIPSVFITFGGATAATVLSQPWEGTLALGKVSRKAFRVPKFDTPSLILQLVTFAEKARREGLLALEDDINELPEEFLRQGIQMVVDGTDPELVRKIMENEMENLARRHLNGRSWWDTFGTLAPGFGMLGTLIGLIAMLNNLGGGDPSVIGSGMAAALITTLYGSLGANLVAIPFVKKLTRRSEDELLIRQIMVEGTLSIQAGENPRLVREKLKSFLSPDEREKVKGDEN